MDARFALVRSASLNKKRHAWRLVLPILLFPLVLNAQWLNYPIPGTPRTRDGKANMAAPAPRARGGKPDLSGVWHPEITPIPEWRQKVGDRVVDNALSFGTLGMTIDTTSVVSRDFFMNLPKGDNPMRPGVELMRGATVGCHTIGFPRSILLTEVHKIIEAPGITLMLIEADNETRQVYTDGRRSPKTRSPLGTAIQRVNGRMMNLSLTQSG